MVVSLTTGSKPSDTHPPFDSRITPASTPGARRPDQVRGITRSGERGALICNGRDVHPRLPHDSQARAQGEVVILADRVVVNTTGTAGGRGLPRIWRLRHHAHPGGGQRAETPSQISPGHARNWSGASTRPAGLLLLNARDVGDDILQLRAAHKPARHQSAAILDLSLNPGSRETEPLQLRSNPRLRTQIHMAFRAH